MTLKRTLSQLLILTTAFMFAFSLNYLYAAVWQGPPAGTPPANNVDSPINVGTTNQVKDANLSVGHSANTASDYGLISYGRLRTTIGGVEFPDGTVQTTAASSSVIGSGTGAIEIVGYVCQGGPNCQKSCTSYGQNPVCTTDICPIGKTLVSHDQIDEWTVSGCTNTGGGGQCQGPWSRDYSRVVGLCK